MLREVFNSLKEARGRDCFADKEEDKKSNVHFLHIAGSDKPMAFYNLDVIL
jgi:hypothetical protein